MATNSTSIFNRMTKEHIVAPEGFNRWKVPPASIAIHLCIGSAYSWSIFNPALTKSLGVLTASSGDWGLQSVVWVFSVAIAFLGLSAAFAGKWLEKVGPRMVGSIAACCWGGGFVIGAMGIVTHQLWMLYLGYGVLGGCGLGLGYVSPVSTLIRWFPDRRGMATGMAIMGFGGGAMIGAPMEELLMSKFYKIPEYLGKIDAVKLITKAGVRFAETADGLREVVVVSASDVASLARPVAEGVYVVGTGSTGAAGAFLTLGALYFVVMMIAAFAFRIPREGWTPKGWVAPAQNQKAMITTRHVHIDQALKTPQFYLLWVVLCFNVTAGIGVLSVAKTMITEIFGHALPHIVDGAFAATYVAAISVFNMTGRFIWASASDWLGRKRTYAIFFVLGTALYLSIPFTAMQVAASPSAVWLVVFCAVTLTIFTMYGGGFSTIPAYLADVFGTKFVGGIHGRLLTAWSAAGVAGPLIISSLRERAVLKAVQDIAAQVDPAAFQKRFGAGISELSTLIEKKTVTIGKLMELAPAGTIDPTPTLYNNTMFVMAGLLVIALAANLSVRPVAEHHYMKDENSEDQPKKKLAAAA